MLKQELTKRLAVRVSEEEYALFRKACKIDKRSLSQFVRHYGLLKAEELIANNGTHETLHQHLLEAYHLLGKALKNDGLINSKE